MKIEIDGKENSKGCPLREVSFCYEHKTQAQKEEDAFYDEFGSDEIIKFSRLLNFFGEMVEKIIKTTAKIRVYCSHG